MSGSKPFLLFLDTVSSAEAFVKDAAEYDDLEFRMEKIESYLKRISIVFDTLFRIPNVSKAQVERVSKVTTALMNLKTATWNAMQQVDESPMHHSTAVHELRRKSIHHMLPNESQSTFFKNSLID